MHEGSIYLIMRLKLNMIETKANLPNESDRISLCLMCKKDEETTEHDIFSSLKNIENYQTTV